MEEDRFGLDLILEEERSRARSADVDNDGDDDEYLSDAPPTAKQTVVMERQDFTASADFVIGDDTRTFPLWGVGRVESILLITEETDYSITVELDTTSDMAGREASTFVDDESYTDLKNHSTELSAIAAYENDDNNNVLDIGPIDFLDSIRAYVSPGSSLTVKRQRAEVTMERSRQKP